MLLCVTWPRPCGVRVDRFLGLSVVSWSSLVGSPGVVVVVAWREIVLVCVGIVCGDCVGVTCDKYTLLVKGDAVTQ